MTGAAKRRPRSRWSGWLLLVVGIAALVAAGARPAADVRRARGAVAAVRVGGAVGRAGPAPRVEGRRRERGDLAADRRVDASSRSG